MNEICCVWFQMCLISDIRHVARYRVNEKRCYALKLVDYSVLHYEKQHKKVTKQTKIRSSYIPP